MTDLELLELAAKDEVIAEAGEMLAMRDRQLAAIKTELREICAAIDDPAGDLTLTTVECIKKLKADNATAWAQAHRLALELECLLLDTKDNAIISKWWGSGMEALNEYQELQPGAAESAEAWAKMRKEMK